ncbi:Wzz/FepE/Etk N-terminal domain-containing protein [Pseudaeromonas sharmana]|uniref:Wzz/FepE/Etk N-terminal domain-containing protein n=1 Tax=Pseudaeromonas sharmana TaxID=328412 RepID=A0ABV8CSQ7_9GAMM
MTEKNLVTPFQSGALTLAATRDDEIDLAELFHALWRGRWWIISSGVLCTVLAVAIALWLPNVYHAEAKLSPSAEQQGGGLSALAGQFGGLASLAGINLGGGGTDKVGLAIEVAKSRKFVTTFIRQHRLEVPLMAVTKMDKQSGELVVDPEIYDTAQGKWVREVKPPKTVAPSDWELYKAFMELFSIEQDKKSGMVTVGVDYFSPDVAKQWVDWLVADLNATMKQRDQADTERNIAYLKTQLEKTAVADMQAVFYKLIEEQTKTLMLAEVNPEYVFKTLDPAVVPEEKAKPKRALMVVLGGILGGMLGIMLVLARHALRRQKEPVL